MRRFRFRKAERLLKRGEYLAVSRNPAHRLETAHFLFLLRPNRLAQTRLGVTVTKRLGPAVKRNRLKRHLREFFRLNKHLLPGGWDVLVIARQGAPDLDPRLLREELKVLLGKAP